MPLVLRTLHPSDEEAFVSACRAVEEGDFVFALGWHDGWDFADYLAELDRRRHGIGLAPDHVPDTFLVAVVGDRIVGRVSIRHHLNDRLLIEGGHIGYGVIPDARRRGFATAMLCMALTKTHRLGIERALLTCDAVNIASRKVIERCGGEPDPTEASTARGILRYWIPTAS
jgi:predicted acetyltransferase